MDDYTTIAHVFNNTNDMLVGRVRAKDDIDSPPMYEGPHDYFQPGDDVTVRVISVNHSTRSDWFETKNSSAHDAAWERIHEGENAEGIGEYLRTDDEAVELFTRYMKIFHPMVPVVTKWIQTGYSQGDSAYLIAWADKQETDTLPAYKSAAYLHDQCIDMLDFIEKFALNQFAVAVYEEPIISAMSISEDEESAEIEIVWSEVDRMHSIFYSEEFHPEDEVLRVVGDSWFTNKHRIERV